MSELKCPYCNSELEPETYIALPGKEDETGRLCCPNPKCSCHCQALEPDIYELLSEGKKAQEALKVAHKAIDCAERFLYGVQNKQIEMQKATRSSHLLLFQMPAMAALCINTINGYKNEITAITKQDTKETKDE